MKDEVLLAAILLAATVVLLILTLIMLCIVFKSVRSKYDIKEKPSEIPKASNHEYDNSAYLNDSNPSFYANDTHTNNDKHVSYYGNDHNEDHKSEWPKSYNMYAVSRSYAFPKAGDYSEHGSDLGPSVQQSYPSSSIASRSSTFETREVQHKSFSEEVFEGINQGGISYTSASTVPRANSTSQPTESDTRIWKSRTPSETASLYSHETNSVQSSSLSHPRDYRVLTEQRSYYTSFKPRKPSASSEAASHVSKTSESTTTRERIETHSLKTSGTKKVFTFDLK